MIINSTDSIKNLQVVFSFHYKAMSYFGCENVSNHRFFNNIIVINPNPLTIFSRMLPVFPKLSSSSILIFDLLLFHIYNYILYLH